MVKLIERRLPWIREIISIKTVCRSPFFPKFVEPDPRTVIHIDEILVVEMDKRDQILNQLALLAAKNASLRPKKTHFLEYNAKYTKSISK